MRALFMCRTGRVSTVVAILGCVVFFVIALVQGGIHDTAQLPVAHGGALTDEATREAGREMAVPFDVATGGQADESS